MLCVWLHVLLRYGDTFSFAASSEAAWNSPRTPDLFLLNLVERVYSWACALITSSCGWNEFSLWCRDDYMCLFLIHHEGLHHLHLNPNCHLYWEKCQGTCFSLCGPAVALLVAIIELALQNMQWLPLSDLQVAGTTLLYPANSGLTVSRAETIKYWSTSPLIENE